MERMILRIKDVSAAVGLRPSTIYERIRADKFPRPRKLSDDPKSRATGWFSDEIQDWIDSRPRA